MGGDLPTSPAPAGEPEHRDRQPRRKVAAACQIWLRGDRRAPVTILDLSYDGCRIAVTTDLAVGEHLDLAMAGCSRVAAEVRWSVNGEAGLHFLPLAGERELVDRAEERIPAAGGVVLRRAGHSPFTVNVRDISRAGCRVELVERPAVGDRVSVKFDGIEALDSRVKWVDGFVAGVEFSRPFHPAVFDIVRARLAQ